MDYYIIRKGHYNIPDIFNANGIYGIHNRKNLDILLIGIIFQTLFMSFTFYQGYFTRLVNGADFSRVVAIFIPGCIVLHLE